MRQILIAFYIGLSACASSPQLDEQTYNAFHEFQINSDVWQLEWIDGFEPDKPIFADKPFNWTAAQLRTSPSDPAQWHSFTAGCNSVTRAPFRTVDEAGHANYSWSIALTQVGCTEVASDGREIISRASNLETFVAQHTANSAAYEPRHQIQGDSLIWLDKTGREVARFNKVSVP